jgi:hypothetical protein
MRKKLTPCRARSAPNLPPVVQAGPNWAAATIDLPTEKVCTFAIYFIGEYRPTLLLDLPETGLRWQ